jgi:uncharacterized repeat protein (TIGR01451 family)
MVRSMTKRGMPKPFAILIAFVLALYFVPFSSMSASAAEGDPVVTQEDGVNGCMGVRTTPGSENTDKRLVSGNLEPGGTVTFEITYPVDATDVAGRTTFVITDCVFIDDEPVVKYSVSFVPNTENFVLTFNLVIPDDAPIGSEYCNYAKTTAAPSESQASNRKAGPACFLIGGDVRVLKVDQDGNPLAGAEFEVVCTRPESTVDAKVIISGLVDENGDPAVAETNGRVTSVTGFTDAEGAIAIAGPAGTECTVTELNPPDGYLPEGDSSIDLTIPNGSDQLVYTFENIGTGDLTISKHAVGGSGTFHFEVDCDGTAYDHLGEDAVAIQVDAGDTETHVIGDIPIGTECTVTEEENGLFSTVVVPEDGTVTIDGDGETVAFTNTRLTGDLTITKNAVGDAGTFTFEVDCDGTAYDHLGEDAIVLEVAADGTETLVIEDIPTGTVCTVTEEENGLFSTVVVPEDGTVTIDADGEGVEFTNTRLTGGLTISKHAVGGSGTFVFDVDCEGTANDRTGDNPVTITVGADESQQILVASNIPAGTVCTVTERDNPLFTKTAQVPGNGTVTIGNNGETVSFTNTRNFGVITVTKNLVGAANGAATSFTFDVDCPGTAYDQQGLVVNVINGTSGSASTNSIPTGLTCTVTERAAPDWKLTAVVPATGAVQPGSTVTFTNTRLQGTLNISKAVSPVAGNGVVVEFGDTLTYTLTVSATGEQRQPDVIVTDYLPGFDPARPSSGKTTYVAGSAKCIGAGTCTVTGPGANGLITWSLGEMAAGTTRQVTFQVIINDVTGAAGETVAVDILNAGAVQSTRTPKKPSNQVITPVSKVLPVKVSKPPVVVLPHTGATLPVGPVVGGAIALLGMGLLLVAAAGRRPSGWTAGR